MVVAKEMNKRTLKISMSNSDSSSEEESDVSESHTNSSEEDDQPDIENEVSNEEENEDIQNKTLENQPETSEDDDNEGGSSEEDAEADVESLSSNDDKSDVLGTNEGWADSVAKILGSNKPKNKKTLVLSRAKKHSAIIKNEKEEKPSFEVIGDSVEIKDIKQEVPSTKGSSEPPAKKVKLEKPSIRLKPNVLEKDRERLLTKIATKGVVQLFNAVRNQQKTLEKDLDRTDITEGKKQKILKNFDKRTFLDTLMGKTKSVIVDEEAKTLKSEDEKPKWSALRDDFMMGAKMKDWDKESVDE